MKTALCIPPGSDRCTSRGLICGASANTYVFTSFLKQEQTKRRTKATRILHRETVSEARTSCFWSKQQLVRKREGQEMSREQTFGSRQATTLYFGTGATSFWTGTFPVKFMSQANNTTEQLYDQRPMREISRDSGPGCLWSNWGSGSDSRVNHRQVAVRGQTRDRRCRGWLSLHLSSRRQIRPGTA